MCEKQMMQGSPDEEPKKYNAKAYEEYNTDQSVIDSCSVVIINPQTPAACVYINFRTCVMSKDHEITVTSEHGVSLYGSKRVRLLRDRLTGVLALGVMEEGDAAQTP